MTEVLRFSFAILQMQGFVFVKDINLLIFTGDDIILRPNTNCMRELEILILSKMIIIFF